MIMCLSLLLSEMQEEPANNFPVFLGLATFEIDIFFCE